MFTHKYVFALYGATKACRIHLPLIRCLSWSRLICLSVVVRLEHSHFMRVRVRLGGLASLVSGLVAIAIFNLQSSMVSTRKGICRTGRVRDVHSRCVRLCERVFTTL